LNARVLRPELPVLSSPPNLSSDGIPRGLSPEDWDSLSASQREALRPWFATQFVACDAVAASAPNACSGGSGALLTESAQCGFLGALYDHLFATWPLLHNESLQPVEDARFHANVVVDISP
jgi:hypothetical protein